VNFNGKTVIEFHGLFYSNLYKSVLSRFRLQKPTITKKYVVVAAVLVVEYVINNTIKMKRESRQINVTKRGKETRKKKSLTNNQKINDRDAI